MAEILPQNLEEIKEVAENIRAELRADLEKNIRVFGPNSFDGQVLQLSLDRLNSCLDSQKIIDEKDRRPPFVSEIEIIGFQNPQKATILTLLNNLKKLRQTGEIDLPLEELNAVFPGYWELVKNNTEAPKEYVLSALLTTFGACLGNKVRLEIGADFVRPNLYMILLGDSTFLRKSTSLKLGTKGLRVIDSETKKSYRQEKEFFEARLAEKVKGDKPKKPRDNSIIYPNEFTPEKLLEKMEARPDGLFIFQEFASLLSRMDNSYSSGLKEMLTELFDFPAGEPYIRETKSCGDYYVESPAPSLLAASTFEWLQAHLSQGDLFSGFLARFCFVGRKTFSTNVIARPEPFQLKDYWVDVFRRGIEFRGDLKLSEEAKKVYTEWYKEFRSVALNENKILHSFLGRLLVTCDKIAIINHCLSQCVGSREDPAIISKQSYKEAFTWIDFFKRNICQYYKDLTNERNVKELEVIEAIKNHGIAVDQYLGLTREDLLCLVRFKDIKEFDSVIELLEKRSSIRRVKLEGFVFFVV